MRVGIIGAGFGGRVHLPAFASIPGVEVIALADSGSGLAARLAAAMGPPIRAVVNWREIVEAPEVEMVSVATPPAFQTGVVCAALEAGKHVLCEKPFGRNASEAAMMVRGLRGRPLANAVGFQFRHDIGIAALRHEIRSGAVGTVHRIGVTWAIGGAVEGRRTSSWKEDVELGGGVLNALGSHVVDYVEWLTDTPIVRVMATARVVAHGLANGGVKAQPLRAEDSSDLFFDLADGSAATVRIANHCQFTPSHRVEIEGERGRLVFVHEWPFTFEVAELWLDGGRGRRERRPLSREPVEAVDTRFAAFCRLVTNFIGVASGLTDAEVPDFAHGLRVQQVLEAARRSIRTSHREDVARELPQTTVSTRW